MKLSAEQQAAIRERYGVCVNEACDKCGQVLGRVRFTCKDEPGEWCSRECRDGVEAHAPGTCKGCGARLPEGKRRGALYCDDACRKLATRSRTGELTRTNGSIYAAFCMDFQAPRYTHSRSLILGLIRNKKCDSRSLLRSLNRQLPDRQANVSSPDGVPGH